MIIHLRSAFPTTVDSKTVQKLGLAPNNESYVINALQFVGVISDEGKKTELAKDVFSNHKDEEFQLAFGKLVEAAYSDLFDIHGDKAWGLGKEDLITFFRKSDQTSAIIGGRQASTFQVFAALSGYGDLPNQKNSTSAKSGGKAAKPKTAAKAAPKKKVAPSTDGLAGQVIEKNDTKDIALTVRVEINLPAGGDKATYDNIFKSIKENLVDG